MDVAKSGHPRPPSGGPPRGRGSSARAPVRKQMSWDANTYFNAPIPRYDALCDRALRSHYEKGGVRKQLFGNHMIDKQGRILQDNETKVAIIEHEFSNAAVQVRRHSANDAYERQKLDKKKLIHREQQRKLLQSLSQRERERRRRRDYWTTTSQYLPPPQASTEHGRRCNGPGSVLASDTPAVPLLKAKQPSSPGLKKKRKPKGGQGRASSSASSQGSEPEQSSPRRGTNVEQASDSSLSSEHPGRQVRGADEGLVAHALTPHGVSSTDESDYDDHAE